VSSGDGRAGEVSGSRLGRGVVVFGGRGAHERQRSRATACLVLIVPAWSPGQVMSPRRKRCTACARWRTPSLGNSRRACVLTVSSDR
jgi:hypothetical protein